jgi:MFS family permease
MLRLAGNPSYRFVAVISARLASNFGTFLSMMALNVYVLELTGSTTWMGLTLAVKVLSGMLATPFIGRAVDRYDRKKLMVLSDVVLTAAMVGIVLVPAAAARYAIVVLMALLGVFSNLFDVALSAAIPEMLGTQDTLKANSWHVGGRNMAVGASAMCAVAANYLFEGYSVIFLVDAATYLLSAVVLYTLDIRTAQARPPSGAEGSGFWEELHSDLAEVRGLENARTVALFLSVLLLDAFASGSHNIGFPVFSRGLYPAKPMLYYGIILAFWAAGNVAGIYHLNRQGWLRRLRPESLYLSFTAIMSGGMILVFQAGQVWSIALSSFLAGVGDGTYQTYFATYIQQVPDAVRGKVFALSGLAVRTGLGLGFMAVPFVMERLGAAKTTLLFHGAVLVFIAGLFLTPGAIGAGRVSSSRSRSG